MRAREQPEADRILSALGAFEAEVAALPGIAEPLSRSCFIEQVIESERRVRFIEHLGTHDISALRREPGSGVFDPLRAAIVHHVEGNFEEAMWLVFMFVHFGRHRRAGWRYIRDIYGRLGDGLLWDWPSVSSDVDEFRSWLDANQEPLTAGGPHGFGNHRKYESLSGSSAVGTGAVVESYVGWVRHHGSHSDLVASVANGAGGDPAAAFDSIYRSMRAVRRFGRTARFDYLTTLRNIGLADVRAGRPYLVGATGPLRGARLLLAPGPGLPSRPTSLDRVVAELDEYLEVGCDVLEDALCNWQKSPTVFRPFRG